MSNINEVRQVLMNELGLTRSTVREMVKEIVTSEVEKTVRKMKDENYIEKIVVKEINRLASSSIWDSSSIRKLISEAAGNALQEKVFQQLHL